MSAPRRRKREVEEEHEDKERWLVSYSDMMTVLVALFIVLYAMGQVDQVKYDQLRASLAAGFGAPQVSILTDGAGIMSDTSSVDVAPTIDGIIPTLTGAHADNGDKDGTGEAIDAADLAAARVEYQDKETDRKSTRLNNSHPPR